MKKRKLPPTISAFTLVELLVVFSIISLLLGLGYANFRGSARRQAVLSAARKVEGDLRLAQEMALAGNKPGECVAPNILRGYRFIFYTSSPTNYRIRASCSSGDIDVGRDSNSVDPTDAGITITNTSNINILFKTLGEGTNIASGGSVVINVENTKIGAKRTITVTSSGEMKLE